MQSNVLDLKGKVLRQIDLDDRVFGIEPNQAVVHQAVVTQQANARQGTHDTRTRAEVAGGGKKPYRQKGTGYARQGSTRAPHYRTGGVVFGPHPRSYEKAFPKKMARLAMRSVLSARAASSELIVLDSLSLDDGKTKSLLQRVHVVTPNGLNLLDILRLPRLVLTEAAVALLTQTLTKGLKTAAPAVEEAKPRRSRKAREADEAEAEEAE
jgi:ribosomal protein L4